MDENNNTDNTNSEPLPGFLEWVVSHKILSTIIGFVSLVLILNTLSFMMPKPDYEPPPRPPFMPGPVIPGPGFPEPAPMPIDVR
jgi:hypothetical protein